MPSVGAAAGPHLHNMLGRGAPLICIIRRRLIPLQLIISSDRSTSFPHCGAQPSGFPHLVQRGQVRWDGLGARGTVYHVCLHQVVETMVKVFLLSHADTCKSWELGRTDASALLRLLIRNAFGSIRVSANLQF